MSYILIFLQYLWIKSATHKFYYTLSNACSFHFIYFEIFYVNCRITIHKTIEYAQIKFYKVVAAPMNIYGSETGLCIDLK
jgi:hypothetical protein